MLRNVFELSYIIIYHHLEITMLQFNPIECKHCQRLNKAGLEQTMYCRIIRGQIIASAGSQSNTLNVKSLLKALSRL